MNAVRTHIEHFISSNPLLASTSCADPVNNLKSPPKQPNRKTPRIILNLTETNQQPIRIRSRSASPFWIKGQTSTYSEVVKTGCISINNSRSPSPESKKTESRISRKSGFNLLQTPSMRNRSKSPKDTWQHDDLRKSSIVPLSFNSKVLLSKESSVYAKKHKYNLELTIPNSKQVKRRSRSRKNRSAKKNFENESYIDKGDNIETNMSRDITVGQYMDKGLSIKPKIIVSDDVQSPQNECDNPKFENEQNQVAIVETCAQTDESVADVTHNISNKKQINANTTVPLNTISSFSKSRLSLTSVPYAEYTDSCFDLNERLKGIFGSVDEKHYSHRVFDRPRSKSDTRDLNKLTQIFTDLNTNKKYTCRFERSAESVKNNSNRDYSNSARRSFDNILSPFGNQTEWLIDMNNEHNKSVR